MKSSSMPVSKREKLCYLLDHWDEIHDPNAVSSVGSPGDGTSTPQLGPMSRSASVVELVRCLAVLRGEAPSQSAHLMALHCAEWRVKRWSESKRRKGGKLETVARAERERIVPRWVDMGKVRRAEDRLVVLFRGPVSIPEPLYLALTKSSSEIADIERKRRGRRVAA